MKTILKLLVVVLFISAGSVNAQKSQKVGHIDFQSLIQVMPETAVASAELLKQQTEMETQLDNMRVEYNRLVNELQTQQDSLLPIVIQAKSVEIGNSEKLINDYFTSAQQQLGDLQATLTQPIVLAAQNAVKEVAKEKGYSYVFNSNPNVGALLVFPELTDDLLPLVKEKLGIK
ncbi:OmpH family outer membrane protein [Bacteroidota bacterium]